MKLELTIDRFEGAKAILKNEDNETVVWPKNKLPRDVKEGSILALTITDQAEAKNNKEDLAKDILNEILDVEEK